MGGGGKVYLWLLEQDTAWDLDACAGSSGVDFSNVIVYLSPNFFCNELEAKKLDIDKWWIRIKLSPRLLLNENRTRNWSHDQFLKSYFVVGQIFLQLFCGKVL